LLGQPLPAALSPPRARRASAGLRRRQAKPDPAIEKRIQELIPSLEGYIATGMKAFDVPGLAIGIVAGDKLIYAKGFGGRRKDGGELVDSRTVFQIGSTTKANPAARFIELPISIRPGSCISSFIAATMARLFTAIVNLRAIGDAVNKGRRPSAPIPESKTKSPQS
jgi:hypothetical protein